MMFSAVVVFLFAQFTSAEAGGGNCTDKLVGNAYNCDFKLSNGMPLTACVDFFTGGMSSEFDLNVGGGDYGCTCQPKGSFKSPAFDASSDTFICVASFGTTIIGKASSKKLTGQVGLDNGISGVVACTVSETACP
jgi:hypothetical protein